jgi:hypothetical protein
LSQFLSPALLCTLPSSLTAGGKEQATASIQKLRQNINLQQLKFIHNYQTQYFDNNAQIFTIFRS